MSVARLTWMLRRASDPRASLIGAGAYALVSALLLITLGGAWAMFQWRGQDAALYQLLAGLALVLLLVPLAYLGGAAARLSARAQDRRLSTLVLVGATRGQVSAITVLGAAAEALVGALAGAIVAAAATPLVGLIHFRGQALGGQLWLPWWLELMLILGVVVLAAISAAGGLRRVLVTPLGVRTRQARPMPSKWRLLIAVVLVLGGGALMGVTGAVGQVFGLIGLVVMVLGLFAGGFVAINAVGPWVLGIWAKRRVARASTPQALLAARTVLDDPTATWRQVSGAAMAGFVAVIGGAGAAAFGGIGASGRPEDVVLAADVRTGVIVTLVITFVGVVCTTLVSQAATVLDREELTGALEVMGTPREVTDRARMGALMQPLVAVMLLAVIASGVLLFPLLGIAAIMAPLTLAIVALVCVAGVLAVRGAGIVAARVSRTGARVPVGV